MEDLIRTALAAVGPAEVVHADVRVVAPDRFVQLAVRNGAASALTDSRTEAIGVRVRTDRAWGFATTCDLRPEPVREVARLAVRLARAAGRHARTPLRVTEEAAPTGGQYHTPLRRDPFSTSFESVVELLTAAEKGLHVARAVRSGIATFQAWEENKWYGSSDGASFTSRIVHVGAGLTATAVRGSNVQRRSAPSSHGGNFAQAGFEFVEGLDLVNKAPEIGKEAAALLDAPICPTGPTTLVLGSDQLALQVHESVGHAVELDRIFGSEAGFAGTSWVAPDKVGTLRYGSDLMNVVADATETGGLGTFGWDDEGVRAQRTAIIHRGVLVGTLSSRESAAQLGLKHSGGTARASGGDRAPLVRMTNVNLETGDHSFEELLEGVREGVFLDTNRSWSIDDRRLNFQFGTEFGRRIVRGELGELLRNPIYSGMTPTFWGSMDALGDPGTRQLWGLPNCGKGQPIQGARVSHGAPAARFRDIAVRGG
ncbi:MAG: TldD/PmbA family protein [Thermoplasmata archaeon]